MGQQVQESQVANYRRRAQREAPASRMRTLFEQNDVLRQTYTVTGAGGSCMTTGQQLTAVLVTGSGTPHFVVTNREGRRVGVIQGESGRVLAETLRQNRLSAVSLTITGIVPIVGDARVQVNPE